MGKKSKKQRARKRQQSQRPAQAAQAAKLRPPTLAAEAANTQDQPDSGVHAKAERYVAEQEAFDDRPLEDRIFAQLSEEPASFDARLSEADAGTADDGPTPDEHRSARRISMEVEIHLSSDSHFFSGLSGDISEGGVFVSTYRDLATGSPVELEFALPGSEAPVRAKGDVRWHREGSAESPPGVGIAFDDLSPEHRKLIQRFCTMRPPLYYDDVG